MALSKSEYDVLLLLNQHGSWKIEKNKSFMWLYGTEDKTRNTLRALSRLGAAVFDQHTVSYYPLWDKAGDPFLCTILVDSVSRFGTKRKTTPWPVVSVATLPSVVKAILANNLAVYSMRFFYHDSHETSSQPEHY